MRTNTSIRDKLNQGAGWIMAAFGLVIAIAFTVGIATPEYAFATALLFVGVLIGGFASVLIHELGHAAGAWLVGWRVWIISVAGIVVRLGHAPRFSTNYMQDVGGYVFGSPPDRAADVAWRSIVFSAGGPLVSLITGPPLLYWLWTLPRDLWETPEGIALLGLLLSFAAGNAWSALATLWPSRGRDGHPNDMGMILEAMGRRGAANDADGVHWAWWMLHNGVEPGAWPHWMHESIERAAANPWSPPSKASFLAFISALDAGDEAEIRRAAARPALGLNWLMRGFVAAYLDNDAQAAEAEIAGFTVDHKDVAPTLLFNFVCARIAALSGDEKLAARIRAIIASDLGIDVPKPFWEGLFARYA